MIAAPIQRGPERPMSWVCRAPTELEQVKSRTESCRSILKAKYSRPHRGKLDCKRHSIKLAANLSYMPTSSALPLGLTMLIGRPSPGTRRSVREYLDILDEAAWGAASETVPSSSPSRIRLHNGPALTKRGMPSLPTPITPDRPEGGDHRRCRGDASHPAGRGRCGTHND
jgi:hypothetical protein